jgi:hypothetical protein
MSMMIVGTFDACFHDDIDIDDGARYRETLSLKFAARQE